MIDADRMVRAIYASRGIDRAPNDQEIGMVRVALGDEFPPTTLSSLLAVLDDTGRFDFSIEFGLAGHLVHVVQEAGDLTLADFVERWAPA